MKNKENRSKSKNLNSYKLQSYLKTDKMTTKQKKLLFSLRTRSVDVKSNYKSKYKFNMQCRLCEKFEDSEKHYLECEKILENIGSNVDLTRAKYEDIFSSDLRDQISITKIYEQVFKTRTKLLRN